MVATERILKVSVQAGSEGVGGSQSSWARNKGRGANDLPLPCPKAQPGVPCAPSVRSLLYFSAEALQTWTCRSLHFEKSEKGASGQSPHVNYPGLVAFWPHSLVVLGGSQGAGCTSYFH